MSRRRRESALPADGLTDLRGDDPTLADLHQVLDEELVRLAVRALLLGRVARVSALLLALGLGASAIATQIVGPAPFFSDDGRYLATSTRAGEATIWDCRTNQKHRVARGFGQGFTPDGDSLAVIRPGDGSISLIDTETGQDRWKTVLGPALQHGGLAFAPDGRTMIVGWDNVLRILETNDGRERFESTGAFGVP